MTTTPRMVDPGHPDCNDDDGLEGELCEDCGELEDECACPECKNLDQEPDHG